MPIRCKEIIEGCDVMRKTMKTVLLVLVMSNLMLSGCAGSGEKTVSNTAPPAQQQAQPAEQPQKQVTANTDMYIVGNGNVGLLNKDLSANEVEKIITDTYKGRVIEKDSPAGEGTMVRAIYAYINGANENEPSIIIELNSKRQISNMRVFAPEFKTAKGLHAGSTWAEIKKEYPQAKITLEGTIFFSIPNERVSCQFRGNENVKINWTNPPNDLQVKNLYIYML